MTVSFPWPADAVVDAHLHVWDLSVSSYSWIPPGSHLHTTVTAERARAELTEAGIGSALLVQAEDSDRDTDFLLSQAAAHPWLAGVVGWVRLDEPRQARERLEELGAHTALRGVRHLVHDDPRADFLAMPRVRTSLAALAEHGLPFDVPDAWPRHLAATVELADALPRLRIVLDHLGKPPDDPAEFTQWHAVVTELARRPNTVAKVSGLHAPGRPVTTEALRPAWEAALDAFGPDRLLYGGDWPMTLPHGGYQPMWRATAQLVAELSPGEQTAVLGGTARAVYRLGATDARERNE
ncbi:hydrolase [Saccharomonospora piscinae]|uniref:Hydrolase n=1 Tax=Saccharomonospora piscinae TaxID=687388 RepID=A0A1V8ZWX8_SACPI|nr:amidohydrolase family protein [Saccharomonospora piscinae]OQO89419.1 hydrolase [Saccharomonospora piscinae]